MQMSEVTQKVDAALAKVNTVQALQPMQIIRLGKEVLENSSEAEADLLGVDAGVERRKTKKSARFIFKKPVYVHDIKLHMTGMQLKRNLKVFFFGAPPEKEAKSIDRLLAMTSVEDISVGAVVCGFELTGSKPVSDAVTLIEIYGSEDTSITSLAAKRQETTAAFEEAATTLAEAAGQIKEQAATITTKLAEFEQTKTQITEAETKLAALNTSAETLAEQNEDVEEELGTLNQQVAEAKDELHRRQESVETLEAQVATLRSQKESEASELNKVLDKKTFYNEKLEGHKAETVKEIRYQSGIAAAVGVALIALAVYALVVLHGVADKAALMDKAQVPFFYAGRVGIIAVVAFFMKLFTGVFKQRMQTIDDLTAHKRTLESKLILAQTLADKICKETNLEGDAKRAYTITVVWSIMCNHFLNSSVDSVAGDFKVKKAQFKSLLPKLPKGYDLESVMNDLPEDTPTVAPPQPVLVTPKKETTA